MPFFYVQVRMWLVELSPPIPVFMRVLVSRFGGVRVLVSKPNICDLRAVYASTADVIGLIKGNADSLVIAYKEQQLCKARGGKLKNLPALSLPLGLRGFWSTMHLEI